MERERSRYRLVLGTAALVVSLAVGSALAAHVHEGKNRAIGKGRTASAPEKQFAVPTPPFTPGIFPCSECHKEMKPNPARRELKDEHTTIVLNYA